MNPSKRRNKIEDECKYVEENIDRLIQNYQAEAEESDDTDSDKDDDTSGEEK